MCLTKALRPSYKICSLISSHEERFHKTAVMVSLTDSSWLRFRSRTRAGMPPFSFISILFSSLVLPLGLKVVCDHPPVPIELLINNNQTMKIFKTESLNQGSAPDPVKFFIMYKKYEYRNGIPFSNNFN
ncbi:hypothetical protein BpHYR1_008740 [Brachionus plicatilis]|uniref:Uncharacterized protein n=1 Tax=Brachionus plicatilis TaxID=10195 RepID=A0A3M7RUY5_BRAPC|nr:hypothetical protein BpHYR1_008740 [Brachionus plicatilis]